MKRLNCRTHGGIFTVESKRGRPPVRCTPENPCSSAKAEAATRKPVSRVEAAASAIKNRRAAEYETTTIVGPNFSTRAQNSVTTVTRRKNVVVQADTPQRAAAADLTERIETAKAKVNTSPNQSALKAYEARYRLEPLGWQVTGRAWVEGELRCAEITAVRGTETLFIKWVNGVMESERYVVWDDKPSANNRPAHRLGFDPDEMPDRELVQALSGMKVTWWNALGQSEETAIIPGAKVVIEHAYSGIGDETPADRIIKFVDVAGSGFRAFRVGALLKIGK